jgi:hypothetical protein
MRTRSNRSVVIVIFICILVAAVIAYRTKQVGVRDFPRSAGRGPHREVCAGDLTLEQAQREIASDWYKVYVTSVRQN